MYYKTKQPFKIDKQKILSPSELPDKKTIYIPEVFASLFIVCSSISVRTGCASFVCLALDVSVIQWNQWQPQRLDTGCLAGGTKFFREIFFKLQLTFMAVPYIIWM